MTQPELISFIFDIANKLRGPYHPPQYRKVMLPMTVLRRMDSVVEPNKEQILKRFEKLKAQGHSLEAIDKILANTAAKEYGHKIYNTSPYTFKKLLDDPENIARNLLKYIKGFSEKAREIFEKFRFEEEVSKLDEANRLYMIVEAFAKVDLHPETVDNIQMGYIFEELIRKFNEQANEEAGDHFTPREVIRLMTHLLYTKDEDVYKRGIVRTIYDPTCGTGGMLTESERYIREQNPDANILLYGQEYNDESYAICCSDLLIKNADADNIAFGDTLGDGRSFDGHPNKKFHYMLANPPFGVEWKVEKEHVEKEHNQQGESGRFYPGLPRINDGSLLFLLHMISKMNPSPEKKGEGSKIAIVFNGSPLFTGDAGSGESNIRRWIIENDWLDTVIALPDQLFYNTGIFTYIWLVTNRKPKARKGKVQLIDATKHFEKMRKSLGNKRNLISDEQISEITRLYAENQHDATSKVLLDGQSEDRICSKVLDNRDFGYLKITVERPLKLSFQATREHIELFKQESAFQRSASSSKKGPRKEEKADVDYQQAILDVVTSLDPKKIYRSRKEFEKVIEKTFESKNVLLTANIQEAILSALSERDPDAEVCTNKKGEPEPDSELRDTENVPLPKDLPLPLPIDYSDDLDNGDLVKLVRSHCEEYLKREVLPHVPDAWVDYSKTKVGYEIPLNRQFYINQDNESVEKIENEIDTLECKISKIFREMASTVTKAKDSGMKGDLVALKRHCKIINGSTPKSGDAENWDGDILWATPEDLGNNSHTYIQETARMITQVGYDSCGVTKIPVNSLILSTRAPIGHLAITAKEMCFNQGCKGIVPDNTIDSRFLYYQLIAIRETLKSYGQGTTFLELGSDKLGSVKVFLPSLPEQKKIADYLDQKTAELDLLIEKTVAITEKLRGYRQAVIANTTEGKVDVKKPTQASVA